MRQAALMQEESQPLACYDTFQRTGITLLRSFESSIVNNEILTSYSIKIYHSCLKQAFWSNRVT